jgi:hypothetical protein
MLLNNIIRYTCPRTRTARILSYPLENNCISILKNGFERVFIHTLNRKEIIVHKIEFLSFQK